MTHQGLAVVLPMLLLAGCVSGGGLGGTSTRSVLQGELTVSGPAGYCIDESASREAEDRAVVLMGRCDGKAKVTAALLSYAVGPAASAGVLAAGGPQLAEFFTSPEGRATLAASGRARDVTVVEALSSGDAFLMRLREAEGPGYWRAFLGLKGRLVSVSVQGSPQDPLSPDLGRTLLDRALTTLQRANPG